MNKHIAYLLNDFFIGLFKTPVYHPGFWLDENAKRPFTKGIHLFQRWKALLRGFNSDKPLVYNLSLNQPELYLNDIRRRILAERISKKYYYILHDKIVFHKYFAEIIRLTPRLGAVIGGRLIGLSGALPIPLASFLQEVQNGSCYFFKPRDGGGGRGIFKVEALPGNIAVNGKPFDPEQFAEWLKGLDGYIVEEKLCQSGLSHTVYPGSLNTLRVMTMICPVSKTPFIPVALHRFGSSRSGFADNWSQGGLSVWIDVESGKMGKGIQYPFSGLLQFLSSHPDTRMQFEGCQIPHWDKVVAQVLKAAAFVPFLPYIGWDIVLSGDQILFQEANYNPDIDLIQIHRPLLIDERVKSFFKYHGVI